MKGWLPSVQGPVNINGGSRHGLKESAMVEGKGVEAVRISVALVTRNRPESLDRCLRSLRSQEAGRQLEVVVSDDSDEELAVSARSVAERWGCRVVVGPRRGLYANRNRAARECTGSHVRTMDDDHEFPEGHFRAVQGAVESDPESIWSIGEYHRTVRADAPLHVPGEIQPRGFCKAPADPGDSFAISDGACVYPRRIFEKHRFLEVLPFGPLYQEFGARLRALGYRMRACSATYVIHHFFPDARSFNDERMEEQAHLLASYLTYGCYLASTRQKWECLGYFFARALSRELRLGQAHLTLADFRRTLRIARRYEDFFRQAKYEQIV